MDQLEELREECRAAYQAFLAAGADDATARASLGERLTLLTRLDALAGSVGDPLAGTSENDWAGLLERLVGWAPISVRLPSPTSTLGPGALADVRVILK